MIPVFLGERLRQDDHSNVMPANQTPAHNGSLKDSHNAIQVSSLRDISHGNPRSQLSQHRAGQPPNSSLQKFLTRRYSVGTMADANGHLCGTHIPRDCTVDRGHHQVELVGAAPVQLDQRAAHERTWRSDQSGIRDEMQNCTLHGNHVHSQAVKGKYKRAKGRQLGMGVPNDRLKDHLMQRDLTDAVFSSDSILCIIKHCSASDIAAMRLACRRWRHSISTRIHQLKLKDLPSGSTSLQAFPALRALDLTAIGPQRMRALAALLTAHVNQLTKLSLGDENGRSSWICNKDMVKIASLTCLRSLAILHPRSATAQGFSCLTKLTALEV